MQNKTRAITQKPIPLALSLAFTEVRKASDVNTSVNQMPVNRRRIHTVR